MELLCCKDMVFESFAKMYWWIVLCHFDVNCSIQNFKTWFSSVNLLHDFGMFLPFWFLNAFCSSGHMLILINLFMCVCHSIMPC